MNASEWEQAILLYFRKTISDKFETNRR